MNIHYVQTSIFLSKVIWQFKNKIPLADKSVLYISCFSTSLGWWLSVSSLSHDVITPQWWPILQKGMYSWVSSPSLRTARIEQERLRSKSKHKLHVFFYLEVQKIIPLTFLRNSSATIRALALTESFISLISLSISSMKWMTKSTSLCLYICSVWKLVMRKLMS